MRLLPWSFSGPRRAAWLLATALILARPAAAQRPDAAGTEGETPGQFFVVEQPIDSERFERLRVATESYIRSAAARGESPILVFEIRPGESPYGLAIELAGLVSKGLAGARKTVAFVPEPLTGYAGLVAFACDEIVMAPGASIGPLTPPGAEFEPSLAAFAATIATRKGRSADLLVGMLDPGAELLRVTTGDGRADYVLERNLEEYRQRHQVVDRRPAWEDGARGVLDAERARSEGLVQSLASDRLQVARSYDLERTADDPTLGAQEIDPVWIRIAGPIGSTQDSYLRRQVAVAQKQGANLLIIELDSPGGELRSADDLAERLSTIEGAKTVAYVHDRALGVAALLALACDEIVFSRDAKLGNVGVTLGGRGRVAPLSDRDREVVAERAAELAGRKGYPPAVARALVDPAVEVVSAMDLDAAAEVLATRAEVDAEPGRFRNVESLEPAGELLTITAETAEAFGLTRMIVEGDEELKSIYGLGGKTIRVNGPNWVDGLVTALNTPFMSGLLLFVGFFMLFLEMKLPGIGLPAITATLAFLLFFWSRYLGGTADGLEIILFVVGLICLALELFVFPGFGVFGMSGVVLVLVSVVMASHTFIWPNNSTQYRQMGTTLLQLVLSIVGVIAGGVVVARYFPSLPLFNKLVLRPDPQDEEDDEYAGKPPLDAEAPLAFLLGETGRTTTVLRPSGKARFGDLLVDVTADGFYIERETMVQVVDVQGAG